MPLSIGTLAPNKTRRASSTSKNRHSLDNYRVFSSHAPMDDIKGSTILLSVGPPSPPASPCCSDLDPILQSWTVSPPETPGPPNTPPPLERDSEEEEEEEEDTWMVHKGAKSFGGRGHQVGSARSPASDRLSPAPGHHHSPRGRRGSRSQSEREGEAKKMSDLYKTEMCRSVAAGTLCRYGDQCQFAHNERELHQVARHPRYKTQFCTSFQTYGHCKYNDRCTFIHHPSEARTPSVNRRANAQIRAKALVKDSGPSLAAITNHPRQHRSNSEGSTGSQLGSTTPTTRTTVAPLQPHVQNSPIAALGPVRLDSVQHSHEGCGQHYRKADPEPKPVLTDFYQAPSVSVASVAVPMTNSSISNSNSGSVLESWYNGGSATNETPRTGVASYLNDMLDARRLVLFGAARNMTLATDRTCGDARDMGTDEVSPPWLASLGRYIWTPQNEFEL